MTVVGLHHVLMAMPAGGEAYARTFYGELLGMVEVPKPPDLAARGGVWFRSGAAELHLGLEDPFRPAAKAHPALVVAGLDELCTRLRDAGVAAEPDGLLPGYWRAYVADPFGNRIELVEPVSGVPDAAAAGPGRAPGWSSPDAAPRNTPPRRPPRR
jgi:catechol 2,3-dioxygenase-like lactoylglutathione lyase family enzyme